MLNQNEPKEEAIRTYSYSKAGYFNPLWTPQLVRLTDQIQSRYAQYSDHVQYAVTLQTKLVTRRDNFRREQLLIHLQGDFWHFNKRLNYHFFKKSCHRKPHLYSLLMLPVIEGAAFCPDEKRMLHYHIGLDRSLQHMEAPSAVLKEMTRVTKSGGRILACEPDWETFILFNGEHDDSCKIANFFQGSIRNPFTGRQLALLTNECGIINICPHVHAFWTNRIKDAAVVFDLKRAKDQCAVVDRISQDDADNWWSLSQQASEKQTFFASLNIIEISGVIP